MKKELMDFLWYMKLLCLYVRRFKGIEIYHCNRIKSNNPSKFILECQILSDANVNKGHIEL